MILILLSLRGQQAQQTPPGTDGDAVCKYGVELMEVGNGVEGGDNETTRLFSSKRSFVKK